MNCDTCSRLGSSKLPFNCATCARNALYELRIENARALIERESLGHSIEKAVGSDAEEGSKGQKAGMQKGVLSRVDLERLVALKEQAAERTTEVEATSDAIKTSIASTRKDLAEREATLDLRRKALAAMRKNHASKTASVLEVVQADTGKVEARWGSAHSKITTSRKFLCKEAAELYGLRQKKRKLSNGSIKVEYMVGGVVVPDLRQLNRIRHTQITASLTHVTHILGLFCHYLGLRLPAEVTHPHREYPLPTIFPPSSSYLYRDVPFPGSTPSHASNASPITPKGEIQSLPRPRPLYLDRDLPTLAKEDPTGYSLFMEGVTYLAWDVAWVCRTQGLNVGGNGWEDICSMGRNLWRLLNPKTIEERLVHDEPSAGPATVKENTSARPATKPPVEFGHLSHGTAHSFLGSADGTDYMRGWKLYSVMKIVDALKKKLETDMLGAGWEMLEEEEWGDEKVEDEEAVLVGARKSKASSSRDEADTMSLMSVPASRGAAGDDVAQGKRGELEGRADRTKGWTKLKSRSSEG
ncbi:MAG: hypothetical protein M1824_005906 [Vezdaea acicularis]|nr:MAG: hypothetical protein M1824_005906 [Vezdaea acicularis]